METERIDLVIPASDGDVAALSRARAALGGRLFLPRAATVERCGDKYALAEWLRARAVPAPATYRVTAPRAREDLRAPVVPRQREPAERGLGALTKTVHEPGVLEIAVRAIRAVDRPASGVFAVDLKEDAGGVPRVTEINAGRFTSSTNLLDLTGKHNMTAVYLDLARDEPVDLHEEYEGTEHHYMLRDLDATPRVFHADEFFDGVEDARR